MADVSATTEVSRPAPDVFAYVTDPTRFPEWQDGVTSGRMDGGEMPQGVGERCYTTRRIGGVERQVTSEVTHVDPPRQWGVQAIEGPIRTTVDVTVEPLAADRSRLTIDLLFSGRGIGKVLVPLFVRRQARHRMPANLRRLKERLERTEPGRG